MLIQWHTFLLCPGSLGVIKLFIMPSSRPLCPILCLIVIKEHPPTISNVCSDESEINFCPRHDRVFHRVWLYRWRFYCPCQPSSNRYWFDWNDSGCWETFSQLDTCHRLNRMLLQPFKKNLSTVSWWHMWQIKIDSILSIIKSPITILFLADVLLFYCLTGSLNCLGIRLFCGLKLWLINYNFYLQNL